MNRRTAETGDRAVIASVLTLCALGAASPVWAQVAEPANSLLAQDTLTGDWGGHRSALTGRGVELGLAVYQDVLSAIDGGLDSKTYFPGLVEPTVTLDLGRLLGWEGTKVFLRGLAMYGRDPGGATGSLNAPSNVANTVETTRLFEAWIERPFLDETLWVRAGLYAADAEFDVKETTGVFLNGGFGTGVDLSQSGLNGPCIYPTSCLGLRFKYEPAPRYYLQAAVLDGAAGNPDDPYGTHLSVDLDDEGVLTLGEVGYQRGADEGRFLRAAIGIWHYSAEFDAIGAVDAEGNPRQRHAAPGVYALLEGELYREPGESTQGLIGFVRVGIADDEVYQVGSYARAGLARTGLVPRRDEDVTAIGVSVPFNGSRFEAAQREAGAAVEDEEVALELTHHLQLLRWLSLQFDVQYFVHPGTGPAVDDALLLGLRTRVTF